MVNNEHSESKTYAEQLRNHSLSESSMLVVSLHERVYVRLDKNISKF